MHRLARQRRRLHAADPRCFYCGVETFIDPPPGWRRKFCPLLATIEHLRSRNDPRRREPLRFPGERRHVLACMQCNQARANDFPVEVRRELSRIGHIQDPEERRAAREEWLARAASAPPPDAPDHKAHPDPYPRHSTIQSF